MDEAQTIQQANFISDKVSEELGKLMTSIDSKIDSGREQYVNMKSMMSKNMDEWKINREKRIVEAQAVKEEAIKRSEKRKENLSEVMDKLMIPQDMLRKKLNDLRANIADKNIVGKMGERVSAFKGNMGNSMEKFGKSISGKLMKGVGKVMTSTLMKFFSAAMILQFLTSPAGMMLIAFISAWFKNTVWIPIILPIVDKVTDAISFFKDMWGNAKQMLEDTINFWKEFPDKLNIWYNDNIKPFFDKIMSFITPIVNVLFKVIRPMLILYKKMIGGILSALGNLRILPNKIQDKLKALAGEVRAFEIPESILKEVNATNEASSEVNAVDGQTPIDFRPQVVVNVSKTMDSSINDKAKRDIVVKKQIKDDDTKWKTRLLESNRYLETSIVNNINNNTTNQNVSPTVITVSDDFKGEPSFDKDTF